MEIRGYRAKRKGKNNFFKAVVRRTGSQRSHSDTGGMRLFSVSGSSSGAGNLAGAGSGD